MNIDKRENCLQEKLFVFLYEVFGEHISTRFRKWEGKQIFFLIIQLQQKFFAKITDWMVGPFSMFWFIPL